MIYEQIWYVIIMYNIFAAIGYMIFAHVYHLFTLVIVNIYNICELWWYMNKLYIWPTSHTVQRQIKYINFAYVTLDHMWGNILFTTLLCHSNWNKPGFLRFRNLWFFAILLLFVPMQTVARQWKPSSVLLHTSLLLHVSIFLDWAEETKCANMIRDSQASNVFFNEHCLLDSKHHKTHWSEKQRT